ncbi:hypothetical protein HCJ96_11105 [Alteromonas sp. MYP5]|uniref:Uncharacterized protein n=1 Tax=Alteromonas ponticola TaxID=2720613 RepID=A0ABX1R4J3_9ALTE|nr:hypothetical protein [Alteromonas ponticola]
MVSSKHKYRFFTVDNVIFDVPSRVYDERAVEGWFRAITQEASRFDKWMILSLPDNSLSISSRAASNLSERLPHLKRYGCLGFLLLVNHINARIFHHSLKDTPPEFDFVVSESMEYLCQQAELVLGEQGRLNTFQAYS